MKSIKNNKLFILLPVGLLIIIVASGFKILQSGGNGWVAPKEADKHINPIKGSLEGTKAGKKLYTKYCTICHGPKGKGDGIGGASLNPKPADFTKDKFQNQSDGAIHWKITEGRSPMAAYKNILSEEERWELVNYLRTFKKTPK